MNRFTTLPSVRFTSTAVLLFLLSGMASGAAFRFEMIVFERPNASGEATSAAREALDLDRAVGTLDSLSVGGGRLDAVAYTLNKRGMVVHKHIAWVQSPRRRNSETWYRLGGGRLDGLVRVTLGRFLHVDADLQVFDTTSGEPVRARMYRRMRSGELHYLDHPRLGVVIRADRVRSRRKPNPADAAAGEPKPAQPPSN